MDYLRQRARHTFLHRVSIRGVTSDYDIHEIRGSEGHIVCSKIKKTRAQMRNYLLEDSGESVFKIIYIPVALWSRPADKPCDELEWVPNVASELGIDLYLLGLLYRDIFMFKVVERDVCGKGRIHNILFNDGHCRIVASYDVENRSTICLVLSWVNEDATLEHKMMVDFIEQSKELYGSSCFLPLLLLSMVMQRGYNVHKGYLSTHFDSHDKETLEKWEDSRIRTRWCQRYFTLSRVISDYLQKQIDASAKLDFDVLPRDAAISVVRIREVLAMLEPDIAQVIVDCEWQLQRSDDFRSKISQHLMREDTMASIELAKASAKMTETGIELTRAAKRDSSSMKVIAIMTMIFLPGTFFAALFAVPSLHWDGENVVGGNFWVYWVFTIPFTVLIIILWLAITQRKEMKSMLDASVRLWLAQSKALKERLFDRQPKADEENGIEMSVNNTTRVS
ncbi:hypothetical protein F5Y04DRAFT_282181 [Hypomontagnella monticulosa]|nr:hypothetical protein F5Y04DRAFT_282181 [Hypomontagnella monticulosa]